ncbi:YceI family protein [Akkermansiaceae bacterium]|jgi:polyisoprenoid-binding protein YceI|nr:YceI family protein [Akkermansiaceae bacterium]MDA7892167.1 YceI family protein [Akkermansiaceae bacterium]MDB4680565.1 YceI family protein [Akkermansiaceae bacterium]MDF1711505.1 YceI family protein [Akkermansiaceae bacterium]
MKKLLSLTAGILVIFQPSTSQAASLKVDYEKSNITVHAKATGGGFKGFLTKYEAKISGDASTLKPSSAAITWKFADLDTKEKKRNEKMLSWLDTGKHPGGSFKLSRVFDKKVVGKTQTYALGTITIHGVSKQIVFPINYAKNGDKLTITGQASLTTTDFDLPIIRMALIATVNPKLVINFSLTGTVN